MCGLKPVLCASREVLKYLDGSNLPKVVKNLKYAVLVARNVYSLLQVGTTDNYVVTTEKQMYVLVQKT